VNKKIPCKNCNKTSAISKKRLREIERKELALLKALKKNRWNTIANNAGRVVLLSGLGLC